MRVLVTSIALAAVVATACGSSVTGGSGGGDGGKGDGGGSGGKDGGGSPDCGKIASSSLEGNWSYTTTEDAGTEQVTVSFDTGGKFSTTATLAGCTETCSGSSWTSTATSTSITGGSCSAECAIMGMTGGSPCFGAIPGGTCGYELSDCNDSLTLTGCAMACDGSTVTIVLTRR
jgi:hypothetical protein